MQVCELPLMVGYSLSKRLSGSSEAQLVSKDAFMQFWTSRQLLRAPLVDSVFACFKQEGQEVRRAQTPTAVVVQSTPL